uniref:Queuosine 5'-phosphate N-glycosylase/hydrolase n=1 Tax=Mycena chlorophos TaxID=658473 RepID=A0ABQ0LPP5_MYCCL|nr:predicted protein [Mycena chlorophos]
MIHAAAISSADDAYCEKPRLTPEPALPANPVIESTEFAYRKTNIVKIDDEGVRLAAKHIHTKMRLETYTPRTWRTHPLHICPPDPYAATDPQTKTCLDWIFLISALNFSFWSEREGTDERYGVRWFENWDEARREGGEGKTRVWTGYWSLVAALDRAMQDAIPITDPRFYSSETLCPDMLIERVFRPREGCVESVPLLSQRIAIMREVGFILCHGFGGSYQNFLNEFQREHNGQGTALQLVQKVVDTFPSFRDEVFCEGRRVCIWKRAQILVAETWAAFYPADSTTPHPLFPSGPNIHQLTMFADYRVPQILHHLRILTYPPSLVAKLRAGTMLEPGSAEELSLRAASIVAVERVRNEMQVLAAIESAGHGVTAGSDEVSSVLIDFYLWDLAKRVERGEERIEGIETAEMVPTHRTRSIWY